VRTGAGGREARRGPRRPAARRETMAAAEARTFGDTAAAGGPAREVVALGVVTALVFGALATGSSRLALVGTAGIAAAVGLALLVSIASARTADVLFAGLACLVAVPVDKYFGYQAHVGGWPGIRVSAADLLLLLLAPLALLSRVLDRRRSGLPSLLVAIVACAVVQYGVSLLGSTRTALSLYEIASTLHALAVAWVVAVLFRRRHVGAIVGALALLVWLHTGFALAQVATGRPLGAGIFGGRDEILNESLTTGAAFLRPSGLFPHPIVYADFLFLTLPVIAAGAASLGRAWQRWLLALTVLAGAGGLALTLSRGAWLAALVAGATFVALGVRRRLVDRATLRRIGAAAAVAGIALAVALGPRVYDRLTESQAGNLDVRFDLNWIALRMVADRPLAGQGLNTFVEVMERFDPKDVMAYFPAPAHNLYLLEAAEAGAPALLLLLATFGFLLTAGVRGTRRIADPALAWLAIAVVSGVAGLAVSQLADFSLRLEPLRTTAWFLIGVLFGALNVGSAQPAVRSPAEVSPPAGEPVGASS